MPRHRRAAPLLLAAVQRPPADATSAGTRVPRSLCVAEQGAACHTASAMAGPGPAAAALQGLLGNLARWATILGVGASLAQTSMYNGAALRLRTAHRGRPGRCAHAWRRQP